MTSLHGDAAVDHALDFALSRRLPFALVPCCVFANLNPWRPDVRTYTALLGYLESRAKAAGANVARVSLPFEGKNVLLYALSYESGQYPNRVCPPCGGEVRVA